MALRPPRNLRLESGASILDYELVGEKAATLGRLGERATAALARLHAGDPADRRVLVDDAAEAVWHYFIQRELCGFRDQKDAIRHYGIPGEVLVRLGAIER